MHGHDASNFQTRAQVTARFDQGDGFGIYKATEGLGFIDRNHAGFVALARGLGKCVGHYHFAHVDNPPEAEATQFLASADWRPGEALILDYEPYGQTQIMTHTQWVLRFKRAIQAAVDVVPWIYVNPDMGGRLAAGNTAAEDAELHEMPLWMAEYRAGSQPSTWLGWPEDRRVLWQYAETPMDFDQCFIDPATWVALSTPGGSDMPITDEDVQRIAQKTIDLLSPELDKWMAVYADTYFTKHAPTIAEKVWSATYGSPDDTTSTRMARAMRAAEQAVSVAATTAAVQAQSGVKIDQVAVDKAVAAAMAKVAVDFSVKPDPQ